MAQATKRPALPGWPFVMPREFLLNRVDHVEDREVHSHNHASDNNAEEDNHDRFQQRKKVAHRGIDFFVVEVSNLGQHLVQATSLLTDRDHRDDHWREDLRLLERLSDRVTAGYRGTGLHDRVLNDAVARRLRRNLESFENADARADERTERAREA